VDRPRRLWQRLVIIIATPILAFIALAAWSVSSPVAATPDEDFHLAAVWCGLGDRGGICENHGDPVKRAIPAALTDSNCYAFQPEQSAACWNPERPGMTVVPRANVDGLYPRVFYATMSIFASPNLEASVMAMRLFNSAFAVGLLTAVFWVLPRRLRPPLLVSVLATSVPLGLFMYSSINPSSWALLSAATVWVTAYGATQTRGRQQITLAAFAVLGTVVGAGARADAAAYAVFGVMLAFLMGIRSLRKLIVPLTAGAAVIVVAAAFYLSSAQSSAVVSGLSNNEPPLSGAQIVFNLLNVPTLWTGALGSWGIGWLDTVLPGVVWVLGTAVFAGALFVGITRPDWRRSVAIVLALVAMWAVPFVLLYQSNALVGTQVQPRYILPLMMIAVGVASLRLDAERAWSPARILLAGGALTIAASVALRTNIRRYTTGTDGSAANLDANIEWWWPGAPSPTVTWIMGSVAFAGVFVLLLLAMRVFPSPTEAVDEPTGVLAPPFSGDGAQSAGTPVPRAVARGEGASRWSSAGQ